MRILYVCHRFPYPPRRGGTIRPFNMIKHLAQRHEVVVCSLTRSPEQTRDAAGIAPFCAEYHIGEVDDRLQILRMCSALVAVYVAGNTADYLMAEVQFWLLAGLVSAFQLAESGIDARQSGVAGAPFDALAQEARAAL